MRTFICMAAAAAVAVALVAVPASAARTAAVTLEDIRFKPGTALVKKGDRVRWRWNDGSTPHDVTSRGPRRFKSSSTKTRGTHLVRFTKAGTYRYVCKVHPGMKGKVVVR